MGYLARRLVSLARILVYGKQKYWEDPRAAEAVLNTPPSLIFWKMLLLHIINWVVWVDFVLGDVGRPP